MVDLFKLFMAKPLNGIIAVLCVAVLATHLGLFEVRLVQATIVEQQKEDKAINALVLSMNDTLIRIDENVKILKQQRDKVE